jgi:hypothetical protein
MHGELWHGETCLKIIGPEPVHLERRVCPSDFSPRVTA